MTNQPPPAAIRVILDDIKEEGARLSEENDLIYFDDDLEVLLPKVARRVLAYHTDSEGEASPWVEETLVQVFDTLRAFVLDPSIIPPIAHEEEG